MPLTDGFTSRVTLKGDPEKHIHSDKWHRCWGYVQDDGHDTSAAAAICTASIGYSGSILKPHRTSGKHASTKHRKKAMDYARVLKAHMCWGHACGKGGAESAEGEGDKKKPSKEGHQTMAETRAAGDKSNDEGHKSAEGKDLRKEPKYRTVGGQRVLNVFSGQKPHKSSEAHIRRENKFHNKEVDKARRAKKIEGLDY